MDLSTLNVVTAAQKPRDMKLLNPFNGEETGAVLHLLGYDAKPVGDALRELDREKMSTLAKEDFAAFQTQTKIAQVIAATVGWTDFVWEGKSADFSTDLLAEILSNPGMHWIADQVEAFARDRANFFPGTQQP